MNNHELEPYSQAYASLPRLMCIMLVDPCVEVVRQREKKAKKMMMMRVEKLCCFFPCSGQQMGAVCSILALPLYD